MGFSSLSLTFVSMYILSKFVLFHLVVANSLHSYTTTCHDDEMSALLQFKQSFVINKSASAYEGAYPKTASWKSAGNQTSNCCSWDGVECDEKTGHVVGLDLISSCLYGSINSNNSLFRLAHLQSLNLADNDFNFSQVPTSIRNFPRLRYLNLSFSFFSGQVPYELSQLSKLSSLDLSRNFGTFSNEELLKSLAHNLTSLETLDLSSINISSTLPNTLTNLSLFTSLRLDDCHMFGQFPGRIFKLQNLKVLSVSNNPDLVGYFPEFNASSSPLVSLNLAVTTFLVNLSSLIEKFDSLKELNVGTCNISEGSVPFSLGNLRHLIYLDLSGNNFHGQIPSSLGNLIQLTYLSLSSNNFYGQIPSSFENLIQLTNLDLSGNNFHCKIPSSFGNLIHLSNLYLSSNNFHGQIPSFFGNLSQLTYLDLYSNNFQGQIPSSFGNLIHLSNLYLSSNNFHGQIPSSFGNLIQLTYLDLSSNNFHGQIPSSFGNLIQLTNLDLSSNNFHGKIPSCFENLTQLTNLYLSSNNFHGLIPRSLFNLINLQSLYLDHNNFSGPVQFQMFQKLQNLTSLDLSANKLEVLAKSRFMNNATALPKFETLQLRSCNIREFPNFLRSQQTLQTLDLSGNKLQGQVPKWMLNTSTQTLMVLNISQNSLSGFEQSPAVLPWVNLRQLDLSFNMLRELSPLPSTSIVYYAISNNKLAGEVSPLICNLTDLVYLDLSNNKLSGILPQCFGNFSNMQYLNLGKNSFDGILPQTYMNTSNLVMIDVSHNNFHGKLPRSLAYCENLEFVVLSHNNFTDTFPDWLGALPKLKILTMGHNGIYGAIVKPNKKNLYFPVLRILDLSYNNFSGEFPFEYIFSGNGTTSFTHDLEYYYTDPILGGYYSFTITSKGVERFYPKIQQDLVLIDISINNFEGQIPEFIGKLERLWSLNISGNNLTGGIPSSLGNLTRLESLDLSQNKLSGTIPQQLAQLDFLTNFNVSHNNLTGHVPRGIHITTFDNTSYEGNPGLCGDPLSMICENLEGTQLPPSTAEENVGGNGIELDWKFVWAGLGSGLLVGVVLADFVITKWNVLFIEIVAVLIRLSKRMRRPSLPDIE